ncbi:hypothetical protein CJU90_3863 [Yarrowia sp. C11]|nr:hypothetical protein CKK34_5474 [Yarrowia sp. E02]KAG5367564.1 hypothetical protein CJU90_3863 [Yarrowia sp. C11]
MPRYTAEVMYELAKSPLSGLEASNTDLNSLKIIKRRESLLYRKSFGNNQDALRRFREEAEERKPVEISIDVEDVAESDISLTEYANRYLSQKGNVGRKNKGGDAVHPKFAIALAATQAKTSKSGRGSSSNAFAAFADADENNGESAVAEEDDDDGWNTVPARNHVPTHPWQRAAARKSFGADHHRPSFNSSNKTTGVYFDARRCERRPSLTRDDVNRYFEPAGSSKGRQDNSSRRSRADSTTQDIEWAAVDTSKALPSFSIGASHARETSEFEQWKKNHSNKNVETERYPEETGRGDLSAIMTQNLESRGRRRSISPMVSPLSGGFATVAPLTPPGLSREDRPVEERPMGLGIFQATPGGNSKPLGHDTGHRSSRGQTSSLPLSPPFEQTHAVEPGLNGKPNYFAEEGMTPAQYGPGMRGLGSPMEGGPVNGVNGMVPSPMAPSPMAPSPIAPSPMNGPSPRMVHSHMNGMVPGPNMSGPPSGHMSGPPGLPGPYFAVVLPPEICDQIRRGLLPPPPPPPPMHMMWRGGPLPPGVGIPVPVMPW